MYLLTRIQEFDMAKIAMIVAPEQFRDEELFDTRAELDDAGHETVIASTHVGTCRGRFGGTVEATETVGALKGIDYDAVSFIGGTGCSVYFDDQQVSRFVQELVDSNKVISAICLAPMILAKGGFLKGKTTSITQSEIDNLEQYGVKYAGPGVVEDENFVTADGPDSASEFGKALVAALNQKLNTISTDL